MSEGASTSRARGRRGNRGKYLRSRGRRGAGRAAEFTPRLLLGDEQEDSDGDEDEDDEEDQGRYSKRKVVDNAGKYAEPEVDPNVEEEPEPEVDLSAFLAKQRFDVEGPISQSLPIPDGDDDIDHSLSNLSLSTRISKPRKNNVQTIEWDAALEELKKEKEAADAVRDLKTRFRSSQSRPIRSQWRRGMEKSSLKFEDSRHMETLNNEDALHVATSKAQMEDFLDDLLS